jgi:hypothetical protein
MNGNVLGEPDGIVDRVTTHQSALGGDVVHPEQCPVQIPDVYGKIGFAVGQPGHPGIRHPGGQDVVPASPVTVPTEQAVVRDLAILTPALKIAEAEHHVGAR